MRSGLPSGPIILFPSVSFFITPLVLSFPDIFDAIDLSLVLKFMLYASNMSLQPVAVAPLFGTNSGFP